MIPLLVFLLACAAVYLGTIETAFSALMRLSLRLVAERSDRPSELGAYLDNPLLLFAPVRLLLGVVTASATALFATKQWAPEHFAALGARLDTQFSVVYSCGPGESQVLDAVEKAAGKKLCRLEGTGLRHFAAALAGARLFVGNDSGPAHMAAAVGIPGVVIFSSSSSTIWAPWRPRAPWQIVQNHYDCNPCPGDRCYQFARPECILSVTLEQVDSAVKQVLATPMKEGAI